MKPALSSVNASIDLTAVGRGMPIALLGIRTILFALIQLIFVQSFQITWSQSIAWWPFTAILSNIICLFLLLYIGKKEGWEYKKLIGFDKAKWRHEIKPTLIVFLIGGVVGSIGFYGAAFLLYGQFIVPNTMIQPLPIWAAIVAIILFPLTNTLVEAPLYIGYCYQRLEVVWKSKWISLATVSFFLALQHFTLPIVSGNFTFMLWHFISMLPIAFTIGLIYIKLRRLVPIMIVHYFLDFMLVIGVGFISFNS